MVRTPIKRPNNRGSKPFEIGQNSTVLIFLSLLKTGCFPPRLQRRVSGTTFASRAPSSFGIDLVANSKTLELSKAADQLCLKKDEKNLTTQHAVDFKTFSQLRKCHFLR